MNIEPINNSSMNFNTCKFRSKEPVIQKIKRCSCQGGDYEKAVHVCHERQIFDVTQEICEDCPIYESQ